MQPANIKVQKDRIMCKSIGNQTDDWLILRSFWLSNSRTCLFFVLNSIQSSWAAKKIEVCKHHFLWLAGPFKFFITLQN